MYTIKDWRHQTKSLLVEVPYGCRFNFSAKFDLWAFEQCSLED